MNRKLNLCLKLISASKTYVLLDFFLDCYICDFYQNCVYCSKNKMKGVDIQHDSMPTVGSEQL